MEKETEFQVQRKYPKYYAEETLFEKIRKYAQKAGIRAVFIVLLLYYAFKRKATPIWAKTTILGALGYFVSPIDVLPDITPFVGYSDDLGILMMALVTVAMFINEEVKLLAKSKLKAWFGEYNPNSLYEIESKIRKQMKE